MKMEPKKFKKLSGGAGIKGTDYQIKLLQFFSLKGLSNDDDFDLSTENMDAGNFDDVVYETNERIILLQAKSKGKSIGFNHLFSKLSEAGEQKFEEKANEGVEEKGEEKEEKLQEKGEEKGKEKVDGKAEERVKEKERKPKEKSGKNDEEKGEEKGAFNIYKYLKTFPKIAKNFNVSKIDNLIICTNSKFNLKNINDCLNKEVKDDNATGKNYLRKKNEEIYPISSIRNIDCYYFDENYLDLLVKYIYEYMPTISKETIKLFLHKLLFVSMLDKDLDDQISFLIEEVDIVENNVIPLPDIQNLIFNKIKTWFQSDKGTCLTKYNVMDYLCQIRCQHYISRKISCLPFLSKEYNEKLLRDDYPSKHNENMILLKIKNKLFYDIHEFKIYQFLLNNIMFTDKVNEEPKKISEKILFVDPNVPVEVLKKIMISFQMPHHIYLIFPLFNHLERFNEIENEIKNIISMQKNRKYKKVILITDVVNVKNDIKQFFPNINFCKVNIKLDDFSITTQNKIIQEKIKYQGNETSLQDIIDGKIIKYVIDECALFKLVKREYLFVNNNYKSYENIIGYVNRVFISKGEENTEDIFCSKILAESANKIITISDPPGMGKTTILNRLDYLLRAQPYWTININLNEITGILFKISKENKTFSNLEDFLRSLKYPEKSKLETNIFKISKNVILLLDALDEISPEYTDLILSTISSINSNKNIRKIVITSRPHVLKQFDEKGIEHENFAIKSFSNEESIDFLTTFWWKEIDKQNDLNIYHQIKKFANELINKLYKTVGWKKVESLIGIPLQTKMIADVFKKHCNNYLKKSKNKLVLPEKLDIMIEEKCNADGNVSAMESLENTFNDAISEHTRHALKLEYPKSEYLFKILNEPNRSEEKTLLKMGIIKKIGDNIQFVHRTFSEYFAAKHVCDLILENTVSEEFLTFFIRNVNSLYRTPFFNSILMNKNVPRGFMYQLFDYIGKLNTNQLMYHKLLELVIDFIPKFGYDKLFEWESLTFLKRLHWNVDRTYTEIFMDMFDKINNINVSHKSGVTPLHLACEYNSMKIVDQLLNKGHPLDICDGNGKTPLHYAVRRKNVENVKFLLSKNHPVYVSDDNGKTALHYAVQMLHMEEIVVCLLEKEPLITLHDNNGKTPLHYAAEYEQNIEILLKNKHPIEVTDKDGKTPLHYAASKSKAENVKFLLDAGHPVDTSDLTGTTPLHLAARYGHIKNIEILLENGHLVNPVDSMGETPLHLAVEWKEIVSVLFKKGHPINVTDMKGKTPLHYAASSYHSNSTITFLLDNKHDVIAYDNDRRTPLHYACMYGCYDNVKILLNRGHSLEVTDKNDQTPLHSAVDNRLSIEVVSILLRRGHSVNVRDRRGSTPLHYLIEMMSEDSYREIDIVNMIIFNGYQINIRNNKGETAMDLATSRGLHSIIHLLLNIENPKYGKNYNGFRYRYNKFF